MFIKSCLVISAKADFYLSSDKNVQMAAVSTRRVLDD